MKFEKLKNTIITNFIYFILKHLAKEKCIVHNCLLINISINAPKSYDIITSNVFKGGKGYYGRDIPDDKVAMTLRPERNIECLINLKSEDQNEKT